MGKQTEQATKWTNLPTTCQLKVLNQESHLLDLGETLLGGADLPLAGLGGGGPGAARGGQVGQAGLEDGEAVAEAGHVAAEARAEAAGRRRRRGGHFSRLKILFSLVTSVLHKISLVG